MITKERLEELIEQGATIWFYEDLSGIEIIYLKENGYKYEIGVVDADDREHLLKTSISKLGKSIDDWWWFSGLFETKEELDWYIEFGCIERTERLVLPTWEEVSKDLKNVDAGNYVIAEFNDLSIEYVKYNNDFICVYEDNFSELEVEATKEGYIKACGKAKELFLGEKK